MPRFGFAEAKDRLSALTASANETGLPFIITKGKKPWVEVRPLAVKESSASAVTITPLRREIAVADLDEVFRLSDRIITMYEGRITGEFRTSDITKEEIGWYMTGRREGKEAAKT